MASEEPPSFLNRLAGAPSLTVSTTPPNGDRDPRGVAVVPPGFPGGGAVRVGDALVSNYADAQGVQGRGRTIVLVTPAGSASTFFEALPELGPVGLTGALVVLRAGLVVVGTTPAERGTAGSAASGGLIFLDRAGNVLATLADSMLLRGPWAASVDDTRPLAPVLYVANALDGTLTRVNLAMERAGSGLAPTVVGLTRVASGFAHGTAPDGALVGPTGLVLSPSLTGIYVADSGNNRVQLVAGVRQATATRGPGATVVAGAPLRGPAGMAPSSAGTLLSASSDAVAGGATPQNLVVEFFPRGGRLVATRQLDPGAAEALFGLAIKVFGGRPSLLYANRHLATLGVVPQRSA